MATMTIKNIPDDLYQNLKQQAAANHRSLNSEAIVSLSQAIHKRDASAQNILLKARALRVKDNAVIRLTNDVINDAKQEGRL